MPTVGNGFRSNALRPAAGRSAALRQSLAAWLVALVAPALVPADAPADQPDTPASVAAPHAPPAVHFENDIVPLFSKLGCNSGGCHGKSAGQNGFRLSVFGFDPRADYDALVKEARGRRLFPGDPEESLLVAKATGRMPHGGGRRTAPGSADHELLARWVRQGMPWGDEHAPRLASIRVEPAERVLAMRGDQQLLVTAVYSDGSVRDVTAASQYTCNAAALAEVDAAGRVSVGEVPGEAAVTVNYRGQVGVARLIVPQPDAGEPYPDLPQNNPIDGLVWAKLRQLNVVPSPLCDDATFLRRVSLDTIGTLPRADAVRAFLADARPDKRDRAIDAVLERPEFADYWALVWADVLLVDREALGERGAFALAGWLREQMAANRPYDEWVRELLTAAGNSGRHGPVNFYRAVRTPEETTRAVSQAFLGIRLDCAQCHHHPFDVWGREDFYALAGFFNGLERRPLGDGRELVFSSGYRPASIPMTEQAIPARPPGGPAAADLADGDPRTKLAEWITHRDNPWFARLVANRLWSHFLGRGLVDPVDDLRATNPATNEPLLAWLAGQVIEQDYDLKAVMRLIVSSRVYQLSADVNESNRDDDQNFSHHLVKRLPAEVLLDAVCQVTGSSEDLPGLPPGTRVIQVWDNRLPSYFLDTFGRSERTSPCECGKSNEPTLSQALHLMNAPELQAKLSDPEGTVARLLAAGVSDRAIVDALCLAALGRPADDKEADVAERLFAQASRRAAAEDFLWTLLNSYEFLFVH
ncbi:MAG TPA: DUF1549 domain-containing protein [Planctomycetaceae bacterium]|nr:DUF1549 domain-containing protein [Planctomycetaceae bacterium]